MNLDKINDPEDLKNYVMGFLENKGPVRFLVYRLEFQAGEDRRQPEEEFLETLDVDNSLTEIIEITGRRYGGGAYRLDLKHMDRILSSQPFEIAGKPKSPPRDSIFKLTIDRWYDEIIDVFDQDMYKKFMAEFSEHGVEDFLAFLHHAHCTYPAVNKFLVECLHKAQDYGWDTRK